MSNKQSIKHRDETTTKTQEIKMLREQASLLLKENNTIVDELWDIEQQLIQTTESAKSKLLQEKNELTTKLNQENYIKRIDDLKKQIYKLEIELFGKSNILKNSPTSNNYLG